MPQVTQPTIYALSSAPGRAGVAVIRISGPAAGTVIDRMAAPRPRPRYAALRRIRNPLDGATLDRALVLYFAAPGTETGEDMAEFQLHGGRAIVRAVLDAIGKIDGCRVAEPGEFARRAFDNGRVDLAEVEGLADLVDAETEAQRRQALLQASGALSALYEGWRKSLIEAQALVEATIDFSDEADVARAATDRAHAVVAPLARAMSDHLDDGHRGEIMRQGFRVALIGAPNVGKSSLLNALARREAAIVSAEAGTTRDVIGVRLDLDGLPIVVSDTAGIREAAGPVEAEGIRRSFATAAAADLVLWLVDVRAPDTPPPADLAVNPDRLLKVLNKCDLLPDGPASSPIAGAVAISATEGHGMDALAKRLATIAGERLGWDAGGAGEPMITQARHRQLIESCVAHLRAFKDGEPGEVELRAEDLRLAANALGRITGRVDVEDVLDEIFKRFCVGK